MARISVARIREALFKDLARAPPGSVIPLPKVTTAMVQLVNAIQQCETAKLVILRGPPGSGKTALATALDDLFPEEHFHHAKLFKKLRRFDPSKLGEFHEVTAKEAIDKMRSGVNVIVSNTGITLPELMAYARTAVLDPENRHKYTIIVYSNREHPMGKNTHGVPETAVEGMRQRFEPFTLEGAVCPAEIPKYMRYPDNMPVIPADVDERLKGYTNLVCIDEDGIEAEEAPMSPPADVPRRPVPRGWQPVLANNSAAADEEDFSMVWFVAITISAVVVWWLTSPFILD